MMLKRRKRPRMGSRVSPQVRCPAHLKFVRGFQCCANVPTVCPNWRIEAHHSTTRGAGGGDETVVPLCQFHHAQLDSPGWSQARFESAYNVDLRAIAADLWQRSPAGRKYRMEQARMAGLDEREAR